MPSVEERLASIETEQNAMKRYMLADMRTSLMEHNDKLDELNTKLVAAVQSMDKRNALQFRWMVVLYFVTVISLVSIVVAL